MNPDAPLRWFPLSLDCANREVLIIGGGEIAQRKIELLLTSGCRLHVVALSVSDWIQDRLKGKHRISLRPVQRSDIQAAFLIIAATNDRQMQAQVSQWCQALGKLYNCVDAIEHCNVIFPAIVNRAPMIITVSSQGSSPVLTQHIRTQIELMLDQSYARLAQFLKRHRDTIKEAIQNIKQRREFYQRLLTQVRGPLTHHTNELADRWLRQALNRYESKPVGQVSLVGAGPGDPELLTIKALKRLKNADVILYDQLVGRDILELARRDALKQCVGKFGGSHHTTQDQINELMIKHAQQGLNVVRLKGGDPFIFGRGGEEVQALKAQHIACEVIPGITAAIGAAASAGIPLTLRGVSHSVRLVTAHREENSAHYDIGHYHPSETLSLYMALMNWPTISQQLIAAGWPKDCPVAFIENATRDNQRVVTSTLENAQATLEQHSMGSPTLTIVGEVVRQRQERGSVTAELLGQPNPVTTDLCAFVAAQAS